MRTLTRFDLSSTLERPVADALADLLNQAHSLAGELRRGVTVISPCDLEVSLREATEIIRTATIRLRDADVAIAQADEMEERIIELERDLAFAERDLEDAKVGDR